MKKHTDAYLIERLSSVNKSDRQEVITYLYDQMYEQVARYVQKNSGFPSEAEDVFQDSLIALIKHARSGRFENHVKLEAYFFTICKNQWLKALQKKERIVELTPVHEQAVETETQESVMVTKERSNLLDQLIRGLGSNCYQLLKHFYYEKKRMKEIAALLSMSNEQAAKDKKASCMKKLRAQVQQNPHLLELLT